MSTVSNLTPWGFHAILDCSNCDVTAIQTESIIRAWLTEITSIAGNSAEGEPYLMITGRSEEHTSELQSH